MKSDSPRLAWDELNRLVLEHYSPDVIGELAEVLRANRYERIARVPARKDLLSGFPRELFLLYNNLWGSSYRLFSKSALPAVHRFIIERENPNLGYLFRVMFLNERTSRLEMRKQFPEALIDRLVETRALTEEESGYRFTLSFVPFKHLLIARDPFHVYIGDPSIGHNDRRVWMGSDSMLFARFLSQFLSNQRFRNAVEIGAGTGIQTLITATHVERAIGMDINRRAVAFSRLNADINRIDNATFFESDLFENLGEKFDLVLANPWYCDLKSGGLEEIPGILGGLDSHLTNDGQLVMLTSSYMKNGQDSVLERLKAFVRSRGDYDLDAMVVGYAINHAHYSDYKKHGISHSLDYLLTLRKGGTGKIRRREVSFLRRWRDLSYIHLVKKLEDIKLWAKHNGLAN